MTIVAVSALQTSFGNDPLQGVGFGRNMVDCRINPRRCTRRVIQIIVAVWHGPRFSSMNLYLPRSSSLSWHRRGILGVGHEYLVRI